MKSIKKFLYCVLVIILIKLCTLNSADFLDSGPDNTCKKDPESTSPGFLGVMREIVKYLKPANAERDTKFYLYTKRNPKHRQELLLGNRHSITKSFFDPLKPIRILIHGWKDEISRCFNVIVRNAYLKKGDFNIISVDWSLMSKSTYLTAVYWLKFVADMINRLTLFLHEEFYVSFDDIYLIGHSLGAHIAGLAGRKLAPNEYNTIFGLDPAGVSFKYINRKYRLRQTDASYVETIQTDIYVYGYKGVLGHASIYPGYGSSIKYCELKNPSILSGCRHHAVYYYFAESITNSSSLKAYQCDTFDNIVNRKCDCSTTSNNSCKKLVQVGGDPSKKKFGVYFF